MGHLEVHFLRGVSLNGGSCKGSVPGKTEQCHSTLSYLWAKIRVMRRLGLAEGLNFFLVT